MDESGSAPLPSNEEESQMTGHLTIESRSDAVLSLVAAFMQGLGYHVEPSTDGGPHAIQSVLPDATGDLLEMLSQLALSTAKAGIDVTEPICRVGFRHTNAASAVSLALRLEAFSIESAEHSGA
jgi:hypothetical protein